MQLDQNFLNDLGLGAMPDDQKQAFLQHLYDELELRVGTRLSEGMSDDQLLEFEKLIDADDQQGALRWLETNRPNYKQVVAEELEKLKQEVMANRDRILGDVQAAGQLDQSQNQNPPQNPPTTQLPPQNQNTDDNNDPTQLRIH